jgi:hypothetical protein
MNFNKVGNGEQTHSQLFAGKRISLMSFFKTDSGYTKIASQHSGIILTIVVTLA